MLQNLFSIRQFGLTKWSFSVLGIVRLANRDWACQTERCQTLSNKSSLQ